MRSRNLKPGFFVNEQLADCSFAARLLFIGLWCMADREGRLEHRPLKIKMEIFPADNLNVSELLDELINAQLVRSYEVDGHRLLDIPTFLKHQRPHPNEQKSMLSPFPESNTLTLEQKTTKVQSVSSQGAKRELPKKEALCSDIILPSSLNPSSLNPSSGEDSSELLKDSEPAEPNVQKISEPEDFEPVILIPLVGNQGDHAVTPDDLGEYLAAYPAVDVLQELREIRAWSLANPRRKKTKRGVRAFIASWLSREQDKGGQARASPQVKQASALPFQTLRTARQMHQRHGADGVASYCRENGLDYQEVMQHVAP